MKKFALLFSFLSLVLMCTNTNAGEISQSNSVYAEIRNDAILPFFTALKNGDINAIKQYISPEMHARYKRLLEDNKEYPKFLRDYYRDARFSMEGATTTDNQVMVDVMIEFPDGHRRIKKMRVFKEANGLQGSNGINSWRIDDQAANNARYPSGKVSPE